MQIRRIRVRIRHMPPEIATAVPSIPSYILRAFSAGGVKSCRAHKEFVRLAPRKRPLCKGSIFSSGFPLFHPSLIATSPWGMCRRATLSNHCQLPPIASRLSRLARSTQIISPKADMPPPLFRSPSARTSLHSVWCRFCCLIHADATVSKCIFRSLSDKK